jgi:hypothetical protein
MSEAADSAEIYLGIGSRHLWNVRPKTTQKGGAKLKHHFSANLNPIWIEEAEC